ncbi:hypothetical protein INR49_003546 [Caranx melampygus]|nr:hypothetical protein INR49_003546 [Caranx melampygus]
MEGGREGGVLWKIKERERETYVDDQSGSGGGRAVICVSWFTAPECQSELCLLEEDEEVRVSLEEQISILCPWR